MGRLTKDETNEVRDFERFLRRNQGTYCSKNGPPIWFQASVNLLQNALEVGELNEGRAYRDRLPSMPPQEATEDWHQTLIEFSIEIRDSPDEGCNGLLITVQGYPTPENRSETLWPTESTHRSAEAQHAVAQDLKRLPEQIRAVQAIIRSCDERGENPEDAPSLRIEEEEAPSPHDFSHRPESFNTEGLSNRPYRKSSDTGTVGQKPRARHGGIGLGGRFSRVEPAPGTTLPHSDPPRPFHPGRTLDSLSPVAKILPDVDPAGAVSPPSPPPSGSPILSAPGSISEFVDKAAELQAPDAPLHEEEREPGSATSARTIAESTPGESSSVTSYRLNQPPSVGPFISTSALAEEPRIRDAPRQPPAPVPGATGTLLDRAVEAPQVRSLALLDLDALRKEPGDLSEALAELEDWRAWLVDRPNGLLRASQAEVVEKLRLWHRAFDYYLAADPGQSYPFAPDPDKPQAFALAEARDKLVCLVRRQQAKVREVLARVDVERIEAEEGSPLIVGVTEKSPLATQPTDDEALHGRVARIEPGEGGYRAGGRVILIAHAICFEYVASEE